MSRLRVIMDFIWMLTRVLFLVIAVSLYPDNVVYTWAVGHFIAGLLYVLGINSFFLNRVICNLNVNHALHFTPLSIFWGITLSLEKMVKGLKKYRLWTDERKSQSTCRNYLLQTTQTNNKGTL